MTFSENVTVTGKPAVLVKIGDKKKRARYTEGSGTPTLTFSYRVRGKDIDTDGISTQRPIGLGKNSTIKDGDGNAARRQHEGLATQSGHKVAGDK